MTPSLIAITDTERGSVELWLARLEELASRAAPNRLMVMLRDRQLPVRERKSFGERLRELTRRHAQRLSVNDRLDLAALLDADAIHLSESSVSVADVRKFGASHGRSWWISSAAHQPTDAGSTAADALLLSPIAQARKGRPALGLGGVQRARAALGQRSPDQGACHLYALGGVDPGNAAAIVRAGADGVALIGALLEPGAPEALVDALGMTY
jgi:thiamine-phosphate pyrophosphorylase